MVNEEVPTTGERTVAGIATETTSIRVVLVLRQPLRRLFGHRPQQRGGRAAVGEVGRGGGGGPAGAGEDDGAAGQGGQAPYAYCPLYVFSKKRFKHHSYLSARPPALP